MCRENLSRECTLIKVVYRLISCEKELKYELHDMQYLVVRTKKNEMENFVGQVEVAPSRSFHVIHIINSKRSDFDKIMQDFVYLN